MIPHTIHYCWFGGAPLPPDAERCVASWRRHFPGWEICRWDESVYDVRAVRYTADAYADGKYAFVSDYARFDIIHRHGGVYFDTDVEVIRPMDDIVERGAFMGMEDTLVAPGLGMGAEAGHPFFRRMLDYYATLDYADAHGNRLPGTVVAHTTEMLRREGFVCDGSRQTVAGITIYENDVFHPFDDITGRLRVTPATRSIHHYAKSWCDDAGRFRTRIARLAHRLIGLKASAFAKRIFRL